MKIATWNVNSIRARLPHVLDWLDGARPDILLLQEIKTTAEAFPFLEIESRGYNIAVNGQKGYNGVAILSKTPLEDVVRRLPGDDADDQARYIEAVTAYGGGVIRVASIYLPNGNPTDSQKFPYKLAWMDRLGAHARELLRFEEAMVLGGDYNIIPSDHDVYDPAGWEEDALAHPRSRLRFRALMYLGFTDAFRVLNPEPGAYSYWDYQKGAWQMNNGLRIDLLLLSPQAADRLQGSGIDRGPRGWEKASDHAPAWCELRDA